MIINSDETLFYPCIILANKCSGSCNNINDPYSTLCVPDVVKNMNIKIFNLMSRTNEARYVSRHETCKCKCKLDASVSNNKQHWNNNKCRCECKELIDKSRYDKGFNWNPSNYECECGISCDVGEYLDYENCECRKKLIDKSVEECGENIDGIEMIYNTTLNHYGKACNFRAIYIVLLGIIFFNDRYWLCIYSFPLVFKKI